MSAGEAGPELTDEATFGHWTEEKIRFQDIDRLDHVNNVALAAYAESGRVEFLEAVTPATLQRGDAPFWVIARLDLRFRAQAHFPAGCASAPACCTWATRRSPSARGCSTARAGASPPRSR
ncbi:MAG: acyl-CoA thioesterase [Halofilum sp. (in: g-proteobacteria)]|nr:acyl-CoA thioesterase [Halofilum sp. (in: g-proteobacteria)]